MPFIGNQPALSYTSFAKQDFTTSATTSYTLDHPVTNENEIALFINFVRQEPTTAYTASGTTLTLTSATSASDDMYCVFLGKAVQTVNPPNGSVGLSQLSATGTKDATTFLRGDNTFASAGGTNTRMFLAKKNSTQTISDSSTTKIQIEDEIIDTDNTYDPSTNYRWTPGETGKYILSAHVKYQATAGANVMQDNYLWLYKNGSKLVTSENYENGSNPSSWGTHDLSVILDVTSASDYFELFAYINVTSGSGEARGDSTLYYSWWQAYKLIT